MAIEAIPFSTLATAAVRGVDEKTARAKTSQKEGDLVVHDCRGDEMVTGWDTAHEPGQLVDGGRQKLANGRLGFFVETGADPGAPATLLHGFVAIAHLDGLTLIVDSVGRWENGDDAKRVLVQKSISSGPVFLIPTGHNGTGGGGDSVGYSVWIEKNGHMVNTGFFDTEGFDEDLSTDGPHWLVKWKSNIAYEDSIHVTEKQVWTLQAATRKESVKTNQERYFVVDGDKLGEVPSAQKRVPPHAADAVSKHVTLNVPAGGGSLRLTFDTARISEDMVRGLADLAPEAGPDGITAVDQLELCVASNPEYKECGSRDFHAPHFMDNAAVNLEHDRKVVLAIQNRAVPVELEPAKRFVLASAAFMLELAERRMAYAKTGDITVLKRAVANIDPTTACAPALGAVGAGPDAFARNAAAANVWHNCMNGAFQDKRGEYPKAPWKQFLAAYGIKAKLEAPTGD